MISYLRSICASLRVHLLTCTRKFSTRWWSGLPPIYFLVAYLNPVFIACWMFSVVPGTMHLFLMKLSWFFAPSVEIKCKWEAKEGELALKAVSTVPLKCYSDSGDLPQRNIPSRKQNGWMCPAGTLNALNILSSYDSVEKWRYGNYDPLRRLYGVAWMRFCFYLLLISPCSYGALQWNFDVVNLSAPWCVRVLCGFCYE